MAAALDLEAIRALDPASWDYAMNELTDAQCDALGRLDPVLTLDEVAIVLRARATVSHGWAFSDEGLGRLLAIVDRIAPQDFDRPHLDPALAR